jgi:Fur family transcriptional regulator, ferric uptake regulator
MDSSLKQLLKLSGYSHTKPRQLVFVYLQTHDNVSINELASSHLGIIDQASIYRALNVFRKLGIVQDIVVSGKKIVELSDRFKDHHHHMSCVECGNATCIKDDQIEQRLDELAAQHGFKPTSHQLGINGICKNCRSEPSGIEN